MLTPLEIHSKEFKTVFRGYHQDDVNDFLDQVILSFEALLRGEDTPKLTLEEIANCEFRVEMRGYHRDEVNEYIDQILDSYQELLQQHAPQTIAYEEDHPEQIPLYPSVQPLSYPVNQRRITPEEIHQHEFVQAPHGYDIQGVNDFLDQIIHDYSEVLLENTELKKRLKQYEERLGRTW
ncbi:cell division regulator GpsB [Marininema halotolerans]|uniref:DivIVA domain-containing protein n=1 Tax=Marininema halotolerans TaxID=1155944 RepID=A0A1I6T9S9_9BACL|nr:cell division regulator GpsB [Marininema halotolerans]SFS85717.1 DivIVA domain-containing protein [Marininema halotolerans]